MLLKEIGLENLPNLYVRSIDIYGTDNTEGSIIMETVITCRDVKKDGRFQWFDNPIFKNFVNISMLISSDNNISSNVTNGLLTLNKTDIFRGYDNTDKKISLNIKSVKSATEPKIIKLDQNNVEVYEIVYKFSNIIKMPINDLYMFVAMTLATEDIQRNFNLDSTEINYKYYQGPISSELVFKAGKTNKQAFYFTNLNGKIWTGPVHKHNNKYMAGAFHSDRPHDALEINKITNFKINDNRVDNNILENKAFAKDSKTFYFGDFIHTFNKERDLKILFNLDMAKVFIDKSKYGGIIKKATPALFDEILSMLRIDHFKINRNLVKINNKNKKLVSSELVFMGDTDKAENNKASISEMDLGYKKIKFFEFIDSSFKEKYHGNYTYDFQVKFFDNTQTILHEKLSKFKNDIYSLEKYYNRSIKKQNYDNKSDSFTAVFYKREKDIFGNNLEILSEKINNFLDLSNYILTFDTSKRQEKYLNIFTNINPRNGKPKNILLFIEQYNNSLNTFMNKLLIEKPQGPFSTNISRKSSFTTRWPNTIVITKKYGHIFKSTNAKTGYIIITDENSKMSHVEMDNKINNERQRFFMSNPALTLEDRKKLSLDEVEALSDIDSYAPSFFSPTSLQSGVSNIDLTRTYMVNDDMLNRTINDITNASSPTANSRIFIDLVNQQTTEDDGDRRFENTREYMGDTKLNSISFNYTLEELTEQKSILTEQKIRYPIVQKSKRQGISNLFDISRNNNAIYNITRNKNRETLNNLRRLPPQYKSLIFSKSDTSRTAVLKNAKDLLENPETSNKMFIQYFNIKIVEYLEAYQKDKNGEIDIKKPIWKTLDVVSKNKIKNKDTLCRIRDYIDEKAGIEVPEYLRFETFNSYFLLTKDSNTNPTDSSTNNVFDLLNTTVTIDYTTTNVVSQSRKINGSLTPSERNSNKKNIKTNRRPRSTTERRNTPSGNRIY